MIVQNIAIKARSLLLLMMPNSDAPFQARLGLQTFDERLQASGDFTLMNCLSIEHAVIQAKTIVQNLGLHYADDFTLVLPMFPAHNSAQEAALINNAWLIKEQADIEGWEFSRIIPSPDF